ncbi:cupin domain-containing protein [Rubellimicrobium rubrum]|uniref:Cupin domain-containing protein n=1 Tax=Rubellimicrobium rubrum TaxID=2585369 RepID=A0A5C4N0D8_9RHOB|nr:cupin domain-containing protein [Rubellimicrobium rubrum]TNC50821.1 cupin domain-containing protein [Rubellimicrobium rubrum]
MPTVTRLGTPGAEPNAADLEGWVKVEGHPTMKTWVQHAAADGTMISGTWEATPGSWHATFVYYEFAHIMEGRVTITEDGGEPVTFGPGDALAVEAGFKGVWRVEEPVRKHFAIRLK